MARKSGIGYWKTRGGFGTVIGGKQHVLATGPDDRPTGPVYKAAQAKFEELAALERVNRSGEANTVKVIGEVYLRWLHEHRSENTERIRHKALKPFVEEFGHRYLSSLVRHEVTQWLSRMKTERGWNGGQRQTVIGSISACINWAVDEGILTRNPVAGLEPGTPESRAEKAYIGDELYQQMLARVRSDTRAYIQVLRLTGARPGEISNARGEDFDPARGAIVYPWRGNSIGFRPKTHATRKDRVVYLAGDALRIVQARVATFGMGYLFPVRSKDGSVSRDRPRSMKETYNIFQKLTARLKSPQPLTPYCLRHSFITDWLAERDDIETLSELVGSSPNTIRKHYKHFDKKQDMIRSKLEAFVVRSSGTPLPGPSSAGA